MRQADTTPVLDAQLARNIDAYWRAANYLSVGQIYLCDNPLLREPLQPIPRRGRNFAQLAGRIHF